MKKNNNSNLTTNEQNLININNKYNNWKTHNKNCMCNIHKQQKLYERENYKKYYDKKYKPQGNLKDYNEYNFNNYT